MFGSFTALVKRITGVMDGLLKRKASSISRPFMEYPEKLARLACGSRLSRSRGFSKQGLKCPCVDYKYRSSRRVCARKRNLTTVYDITKIYLDRRKEKFGETFVTDFLCNQSILLSVSSKAFSCW